MAENNTIASHPFLGRRKLLAISGQAALAGLADWNEAKWMFDPSRELEFPLFGGSSIPFYFRKPEIDLDMDTP